MSESTSSEPNLELENFRAQWRQEVNERNKKPGRSTGAVDLSTTKRNEKIHSSAIATTSTAPSTSRKKEAVDFSEDFEPRSYHDLPDKEELLKLGEEGHHLDRGTGKEPSSALEHYEHAVERETQGQLGDSIKHYRRAFKLDADVHEVYKKKHFPPSSFIKPSLSNVNPTNTAVTVPGTGHHSLHGSSNSALPPSLRQMIDDFSDCRIEPNPPPTDASPPDACPLAQLPEEILTQVLSHLAVIDVASFGRLARVSKRLAYLVITEETVWKRVATGHEFGFTAMHYEYACDIEGSPLNSGDSIVRYFDSYEDDGDDVELSSPIVQDAPTLESVTENLLRTVYGSSWRRMFRFRPRIRFNGCYISTVNYTRPGASSANTLTWGAPVHVVTYYRYLRFFRDGTAISLLTTSEPADVVHHLTKQNLHDNHSNNLPSNVMKDALKGRWRLSGPASSVLDPITGERETEGDVHVETEGVVPKYTYKLLLALSHAGKGARNNKLAWKGFWSHNKLSDDWAEFGLRNDRAFYWSRVRSYDTGLDS